MLFEIFAEQNLISRESSRLPYTVASTTHTVDRIVCTCVFERMQSSGQRNANNEHLCRIYDSSECWCVCVFVWARSSSRLNAGIRSLLRCYLMPHYVHTHKQRFPHLYIYSLAAIARLLLSFLLHFSSLLLRTAAVVRVIIIYTILCGAWHRHVHSLIRWMSRDCYDLFHFTFGCGLIKSYRNQHK